MRVKKYFVFKISEINWKRSGAQTVDFWRNQEKSKLWALNAQLFLTATSVYLFTT